VTHCAGSVEPGASRPFNTPPRLAHPVFHCINISNCPGCASELEEQYLDGRPEELQAQHSSKLKKLNRSQVLCEEVCKIFFTLDEIEFHDSVMHLTFFAFFLSPFSLHFFTQRQYEVETFVLLKHKTDYKGYKTQDYWTTRHCYHPNPTRHSYPPPSDRHRPPTTLRIPPHEGWSL